MWTTTTVLLLMLGPHLPSSADSAKTLNQSEVKEDFPDAPADAGGVKGRDTCSIPCDITIRLLRDEKQSICGQLQQSLLAFGRSSRKLMRDVMEEQQRALDVLTSQVSEVMNKVQALSAEVQRSNADMFAAKPPLSHGRDCSDIKDSLMSLVPKIPSGIYIVSPDHSDSSFEVFCEMDYMGGGWTVMQRRTEGLMDFKRPWAAHVDGFGHLAGEHWLGLKKVFDIVNQKATRFQLHVALVSHDDVTSYAAYDDFRLDNETHFYRLHLGRYAGSAGDAFRGYEQDQNQDTAPFSTSDVDNDGCEPSCSMGGLTVESCSARHHHTGWWFNRCGMANLNGDARQDPGPQTVGVLWDTWRHNGVARLIKSVTMKIRRMPDNN
ncbi:angiopoietin-related protein 5 [Entelurus aequoreus]|uniref:angiopoietin-related protein 5 n=1 Tax=Entelurus aequoreus TaxID=161455 RepID=UPI002B1D1338|nr:angiopoietin-related protein 5 [Entelurus aequoreus]